MANFSSARRIAGNPTHGAGENPRTPARARHEPPQQARRGEEDAIEREAELWEQGAREQFEALLEAARAEASPITTERELYARLCVLGAAVVRYSTSHRASRGASARQDASVGAGASPCAEAALRAGAGAPR